MDGDLRRPRRTVPDYSLGRGWGYSATLPADIGYPQVVAPWAITADASPVGREKISEPVDKKADEPKTQDKAQDDAKQKPPMPGWKKALYWMVGLIVLGVLVAFATIYYLHSRHFENTDDAFINGHMSQVSAQVGAKVTALAVEDNQFVAKDQVLIQLDPRDYQIKLDQAVAQRAQAAAQLLQAQAGLLQQQASVDQAVAQVHVAEADLGQQQTDLARYRGIDPKAITRQQLDTSLAQTKSAAARLDANKQAVAGMQAQVESQKAQIAAAAANVQAADSTVANANLQLSYTKVRAPEAGWVTKRTVEVGNYVNPGQSLLAVVPPNFWVTANFKETQLADMRKGQPVHVTIDACSGMDFAAKVDSFQNGTGAVFSSLPAENATGNYVKVVQRLPAKIVFDAPVPEDKCRLALGMSASPRVTVRP